MTRAFQWIAGLSRIARFARRRRRVPTILATTNAGWSDTRRRALAQVANERAQQNQCGHQDRVDRVVRQGTDSCAGWDVSTGADSGLYVKKPKLPSEIIKPRVFGAPATRPPAGRDLITSTGCRNVVTIVARGTCGHGPNPPGMPGRKVHGQKRPKGRSGNRLLH